MLSHTLDWQVLGREEAKSLRYLSSAIDGGGLV